MTEDEHSEAQRAVHSAIGGMLEDGEIAICWTMTIDVAGPNGQRSLAHRAGGGLDGNDNPMTWTALGMMRASLIVAERQVEEMTRVDGDGDDDGDDDDDLNE